MVEAEVQQRPEQAGRTGSRRPVSVCTHRAAAYTYAEVTKREFLEDPILNWPPEGKFGEMRRDNGGAQCLSHMIVLCDETGARAAARAPPAVHNLIQTGVSASLPVLRGPRPFSVDHGRAAGASPRRRTASWWASRRAHRRPARAVRRREGDPGAQRQHRHERRHAAHAHDPGHGRDERRQGQNSGIRVVVHAPTAGDVRARRPSGAGRDGTPPSRRRIRRFPTVAPPGSEVRRWQDNLIFQSHSAIKNFPGDDDGVFPYVYVVRIDQSERL